MRRWLALAGVALAAGCGGGENDRDARQWLANAHGVVRQLRLDVVDASATDRVELARAALRDESQLYGLLVIYTDLGACAHQVQALGTPPRRFAAAHRTLARACRPLARAARLFGVAARAEQPRALVAATRAAVAAAPLLDRAALELRTNE